MSYIFDVGEETVWSPSLRVGQLYVSLTETLGEYLGRPTGLKAVSEDMYDIDLSTFGDFTQALMEQYCSTAHLVMHDLLRGVLLTSLVMLDRGGVQVSPANEEQGELLAALPAFARSMPT